MARRHALVFDDDSAFLSLLQSSLGAYDFEVAPLDPGPENIQTLKAIDPELVFISADLPDRAGYTLCSKTRKAVGKKIFIVFTTATLSSDELSLHAKMRLHANLYIDKRDLSGGDLLDRLNETIGLGPRVKPRTEDSGSDREPEMADQNESDAIQTYHHGSPEKPAASDHEESMGGQEDTPSVPDAPTTPAPGDTAASLTNEQDLSLDQPVLNNPDDGDSDLERLLSERQAEIFQLQRQLEEAHRDARSSPFSSEFLKLREANVQKDWEITRITEKLNDSDHDFREAKNRIKALDEQLSGLKEEKSRIQLEKEALTAQIQELEQNNSNLKALHNSLEIEAAQAAD
ncbi:MAG: response regulator, partial [Desulfobacteraceae bacterium]